jgi:hypothetical protein
MPLTSMLVRHTRRNESEGDPAILNSPEILNISYLRKGHTFSHKGSIAVPQDVSEGVFNAG